MHYEKAVAIEPTYFLAANNLGAALAERGRLEEAIVRYRQSLALVPRRHGHALQPGRRVDCREAVRRGGPAVQAGAEGSPPASAALRQGLFRPGPHRDREEPARRGRGETSSTRSTRRRTTRTRTSASPRPISPSPVLLANQGRLDEAIGHYAAVLRIAPRLANVRNDLAVALATDGRLDEAIAQYQAAVAIAPDFAIAAEEPRTCAGPAAAVENKIAGLREALAR